jgi:hypothetical protein
MSAWTTRKAARRSSGSLERARRAFLAIADDWGDVDQMIVSLCDEAIDSLTELAEQIEFNASGARDVERLGLGEPL